MDVCFVDVVGVVGYPIRHSLSPAIFNAAFAAVGLDWTMVAFEVSGPEAAAALAGAQALGIRGFSVTMPLKVPMASLVDDLSPTAARLGAVNSVLVSRDRTAGDNTDGGGLMDALADSIGWSPGGRRCAVLGAGGAARAVILALADGGAADVAVINRTESSAMTAAALAGAAGRVGTAAADVPSAELVVNATSVGMASTPLAGQLPIDPGVLRPGQVVVDLGYHPRETPLLAAAASQGATPVDGVGMLVHQAARQFTWWTGLPVPLDAMRAAARSALG